MTGQELRERFECDLRTAADHEKVYVNFDLRSDGQYKEITIRLAYAAFLAGVEFIADGVSERVLR